MMRAQRLLIALALASAAAAGDIRAQYWSPGERTLITAFDHVTAVATDMRSVYAATPNGLLVYDQLAREWRRPSTQVDGFPVGHLPTALAWDDFAGELWMGTQTGVVWRYAPGFERWEQGVIVPGAVQAIGFAGGSAWILAGGRWLVVHGAAFSAEPVATAAVPAEVRAGAGSEVIAADPFLRTIIRSLPPDPAGHRWRATALAPGQRRGTWWIGTDGGGLLAYDARTNDVQWLPFGLPSRGAMHVGLAAGLLWFGSDGRAQRPGIVAADTRLAHWRRFDAAVQGGPEGAVYDVLDAHDRVWIAAEDGVYGLRLRDLERDVRRADWIHAGALDGMPSPEAFALERAIDGVWVGTARGLVHVDTAGSVAPTILPGTSVYDLAFDGTHLWAATARGLVRLENGSARAPPDVPPALAGETRAVAIGEDGLWVLAADAAYRLGQDGAWRTWREPGLAGIGALRRVSATADAVWVAAEQGVAVYEAPSGSWRYYSVPGDIPEAPVASVLLVGADAWLGTPAGALRLPARP